MTPDAPILSRQTPETDHPVAHYRQAGSTLVLGRTGHGKTRMPSTVIRDYRYRTDRAVLEITFVSGKRYRYLQVPETVYEKMRASFSKGEYFNRHIRDHFAFESVDPAPDGR